MGPILIFDKSFLESLTLDESVWLDNFFQTNITPVFYAETLADLEKKNKKGKVNRSSEEIVEEIVDKSPIIGSVPNIHHQKLVIGDLLGQEVEMNKHHRPILGGGEYKVSPGGEININFKQFPEAAALQRWKRHEFLEVEREVAREWRETLSNINFDWLLDKIKSEIPNDIKFSTIEDVKKFVDTFIKSKYNQFIYFSLNILGIPDKYRRSILKRWYATRPMPFDNFAPYAAYVLIINLLFYLCVDKGFLSTSHKGKLTNIIDLSYLYYLPFCLVFVSNDKLHLRLAPLFLNTEQTFISGRDLKEDLGKINKYYLNFKDKIDEMGSMMFAAYPPEDMDTQVGRIFDKYFKSWRRNAKANKANLNKPQKQDREFLKRLKEDAKKRKPYTGPPVSSDQASSMTLKRMVPVKRGSWRILPKGIENKKGN